MSLNQNGDQTDPIDVDSREVEIVHILSDGEDEEEEIAPRIGEDFQAELPELNREPNHTEEEYVLRFMIGLSIPLTWVECQAHKGPQIETRRKKCCVDGLKLVPGLPGVSWSEAEKASFLLAIYIFEKNFVEVRRFVETKAMGAILAFYYGDFYRSEEYKKWSEGRKTSKKSAHGQKLFSGLRQQELLSRLMPRVSEEVKNGVLEVCTTYGEDKMSFPDFVSTLKTLVGTNALVQAIGIGTGRQDLTRMVIEPQKSTHARPEIPAGKACSSLTTTEIIKFLSGDYRLSKARSNDLFWEAVWPRLLARGWHSEQPDDQTYLVFLVPGVVKFSRKNLVKGNEYFDSISDVLSKVGKEPELIELEEEQNDDEPGKEKRHSYLQPPRTPTRSSDAIKFTVVDTSLPEGNVIELRTLPPQGNKIVHNEPDDTTDIPTITVDVSEKTLQIATATAGAGKSKKEAKAKKVGKALGRKQKQGGGAEDNIAPMSKRCKRLTANGNEETRDGPVLENGNRESNGNSSWHDKGSPRASIGPGPGPSQSHLLIDLNWPTPEFENEALATNGGDEVAMKEEKDDEALASSTQVEARVEEQAPRRLSTRYRPPTTRTLEAVASGFLTVTKRRKTKDGAASSARPTQRTRRGTGPNESPSSSQGASRSSQDQPEASNDDSHSRQ